MWLINLSSFVKILVLNKCHIEKTWEEKPCEVMVQGGFQCKSSEVNENAQTMSSKTLCVFVRAKIVGMIPSKNRSHCIIISILSYSQISLIKNIQKLLHFMSSRYKKNNLDNSQNILLRVILIVNKKKVQNHFKE